MNAPQRYAGLRTIALILQVLAWVVLALGIIGFLWLLFSGPKWPGLTAGGRNWTGLLFLPFVLMAFFQWFILGSVLKLLTDVEHNTRANTLGLERLIAMSQEVNKAAPAPQMKQPEVSQPAVAVQAPPPIVVPPPPPVSLPEVVAPLPETIAPPSASQTEVAPPA